MKERLEANLKAVGACTVAIIVCAIPFLMALSLALDWIPTVKLVLCLATVADVMEIGILITKYVCEEEKDD